MLSRLIDIRQGEGKRAVLAFLSLLLVIGAYTVVKSVRDAIFLSKFGITQLSLIGIGLALATGFIITIYLRGTSNLQRHHLIGGTNVIVAGSLTLIWGGLLSGWVQNLLPWVLYIWSSIFGVFIVMQFWLLASDLFDPREAKRLFGFIGAGAILGGVSGGFMSRSLAGIIGSNNLLLVASGMILLEAFLVTLVWPLRRKEKTSSPRKAQAPKPGKSGAGGSGLSVVMDNHTVRLLALALLLMTMCTTLLDWQFKGITKAHFAGRTDEMAAFFGSLYAYLSVASFMIQTLLTGPILRRFGVGVGLFALPVSLVLGSGLILSHTILPGISRLFAASSAKIAEGGLRFSIDKASMELMWLPVPPDVKEKGKAFVDTVVDRFATGMTGFVWLGLAAIGLGSPDRIHMISIAVLALVLVWLFVVFNARSSYLSALRAALSSRDLNLDQLNLKLVDAGARRSLAENLKEKSPREVLFTLYLLNADNQPLPDLSGALAHEDPNVVTETLRLITARKDTRCREASISCLARPEAAVKEAAIIYLHNTAPRGNDPLIEALTRGGEVDQTIVDVIKLGMPTYAMAAAENLRRQISDDASGQRQSVISILGGAPPEMAAALLAPVLKRSDDRLVHAALIAAGRARAAGLTPQICELLSVPRHRQRAATTLHSIGPAAVDHLATLLADEAVGTPARLSVLQLIGASQRADLADRLLPYVCGDNVALSRRALRALGRLRNNAALELDEAQQRAIDDVLARELSTMYQDLVTLGKGSWADLSNRDDDDDLLSRAMRERASERIERIFRLLGLRFPASDMYASFRGVCSPLKSIRASSIEFLDNVLPKNISARLLPVLETAGADRFAALASQQGEAASEERGALLERMMTGHDLVLRTVAIWIAGVERATPLRETLSKIAERSDPLTTEVAQQALLRIDTPTWEEPKMGLTTIEKALKLQQVDVLQRASTEDLGYVAQISSEEQFDASDVIYNEGDVPEALFVVVNGKVRLHKGDVEIASLGEGEAFGSWALLDESPRVASATALEETTLLKVGREEFLEILSDRVDIIQAVFKAMVERLRSLASAANDL